MTSLQTLIDRQQLADVVAAYCRAVDRRDFAALEHLYHPEALHDHGGLFRGDRAAFIAWLRESLKPDLTTFHFVGNALFSINGDVAEGEIYTVNIHVFADGAEYIAAGRYLDRYVRAGDGWLIKSRLRLIDWSHQGQGAPGSVAAQIARGATDRTDASWSELSLLGEKFGSGS